MPHKTKQAALKEARKALGPEAIEGVDFQLRNTGAGWSHEDVPPAGKAPAKPRRKAARADTDTLERPKADPGGKGGKPPRKPPAPPQSPAQGQSKTELLVTMMSQPGGATSKAMEEATSWQPHSVRGLIGTLKKRGVKVESHKDKGQPTTYVIAKGPAATEVGDVL